MIQRNTFTDVQRDILSNLVASSNNLGWQRYKESDFNGALEALRPIIEIMDSLFQNIEDRRFMKQDLHLDKVCGLIADIYGALDDAENAFKFYKYHHFMAMQLKHDFSSKKSQTLYQFRRFTEYSLANILNKEITLSHPSVMNDIIDTLIFTRFKSPSFGRECHDMKHLPYFEKSYNNYRIASFSSDNIEKGIFAVSNTLMWAHYADEHRGFCVEYEFSPNDYMRNDVRGCSASRLFRIKYVPKEEQYSILNKEPFTARDAFLTKSSDWEYENEIRLIQYKPANSELRQQYSLDDQTRITAIYFGVRCPESTISIIRKLIDSDIPLYKMKIDYSDVFNLKYYAI